MFKHKKQAAKIELTNTSEAIKCFLEHEYMSSPYIVPEHIDAALTACAEELSTLAGFSGIVNVGGTANGSYELRSRLKPNPASDLDYYLVGDDDLDLHGAARVVEQHMKRINLTVDGVLNGKNSNNFLDLDRLDEIIDQGDAALLALCFQSFYGVNPETVQKRVIETIVQRPDAQEVWDVIASFHAQSLSLHHGSFDEGTSDVIMDDFYPIKVEKYELDLTPAAALSRLSDIK